jgi:DNA-binding NtrC family response regulator
LIVDDDELMRRTAQRLLQDAWEIFTARSATEAVSVIKRHSIDVVLTDYEMPGENGIWLLEEVKRLSPGTHRVLFSGLGPDTLPEHLTSGLVVRFITKPSSRAALFSALSATF